jgi:hypothetical protein
MSVVALFQRLTLTSGFSVTQSDPTRQSARTANFNSYRGGIGVRDSGLPDVD